MFPEIDIQTYAVLSMDASRNIVKSDDPSTDGSLPVRPAEQWFGNSGKMLYDWTDQ